MDDIVQEVWTKALFKIETHDSKVYYGFTRDLEGYAFRLQLWIDEETRLPVRLELHESLHPDEGGWSHHAVTDQFQWGLDLEPDLFELEIPDGFVDESMKYLPVTEQEAWEGLY